MASRDETGGGFAEQSRWARAQAGWTLLAVAVLALGTVWFFARERRREGAAPPLANPREETSAESTTRAVELEQEGEPARVEVAAEGANAADPSPNDEDPPTPERRGSGQALLRVEVVAVETGMPLGGVLLNLFVGEGADEDEDREWACSTQSDPSRGVENDNLHTDAVGRGEFVVPAGFAYTLRARGENGLAQETEVQVAALHAGEERSVALALRTAWDREWSGRVIDGETELPLAGAEVTALVASSADTLDGLHVLARGRSAANGRVGLHLPAWERIAVCAVVPGYFRGCCRVEKERSEPDEVSTVALLRAASLAARVLGTDGKAAAGIDVRLHWGESGICYDLGLFDDIEWRAATDADGRCDFGELPARADIHVDLMRGERVLLRPGDAWLPPGGHRSVEWRLQSGCTLVGAVHDAGGGALAEVPLVLSQVPKPLWMLALREGDRVTFERSWPELVPVAQLRSDAAGRFELADVGPGVWALGPPEDAREWPQASLVFEIETDQSTEEVELELAHDLSIEGVVLDPEGTPLREIGVTCTGSGPGRERVTRTAWSERDGRFVVGPLLEGDYRLGARPDDPMHAAPEVVLAHSGAHDVVLRLRWGAVLGGSVVDGETGEPLKAMVSDGNRGATVTSGNEFLFESLSPGAHDLVARTDDGRIGVLSVQARERQHDEELVFPVRRGAKLTLRSLAPKGAVLQIEVEWQGISIARTWGDPEPMTVPPGAIVARWLEFDRKGGSEIVHEESRVVEVGQEVVLEYREP